MDEQTEQILRELLIKVESLSLKIKALEDSVINLTGFERQVEDGSQQGMIRYVPPKAVVESRTV